MCVLRRLVEIREVCAVLEFVPAFVRGVLAGNLWRVLSFVDA